MKSLIALFMLCLLGSTAFALDLPIGQGAPTGAIACSSAPAGALSGYRLKLANNGYGFCQVTSCDANQGFDTNPYAGKCALPPQATWLSTNQSVTESEISLSLRAQLNRPASADLEFLVTTSGSTAMPEYYEIVSPSVKVKSGQSVSELFIIKIHRVSSQNGDQVLKLNLPSGGLLSITILEATNKSGLPNSLLTSHLSVNDGEALSANIEVSQVLSRVFPTALKINVGGTIKSMIVPANSKIGVLKLDEAFTTGKAGQTLQVSVAGLTGAASLIITQAPSGDLVERWLQSQLTAGYIDQPGYDFSIAGWTYVKNNRQDLQGRALLYRATQNDDPNFGFDTPLYQMGRLPGRAGQFIGQFDDYLTSVGF